MKKLITFYYISLAAIVVASAVQTIYVGSLQVGLGDKIALYQEKKKMLLEKKEVFQKLLSQEESLSYNNNLVTDQGFTKITSIQSIPGTEKTVASR